MGWTPSMDLEQSKRMFNDEFRREVMVTGHVTNIRIVNIEVRKMMDITLDITCQLFANLPHDLHTLFESQDCY